MATPDAFSLPSSDNLIICEDQDAERDVYRQYFGNDCHPQMFSVSVLSFDQDVMDFNCQSCLL